LEFNVQLLLSVLSPQQLALVKQAASPEKISFEKAGSCLN